jgi:hypothetical protein
MPPTPNHGIQLPPEIQQKYILASFCLSMDGIRRYPKRFALFNETFPIYFLFVLPILINGLNRVP